MNIMPGFGIAMGGIGGLDAATAAWVAEVVSNGGTVSDDRAALVDELIVGLKADGIWSKLDRLWLFAAEDEESALTDLVGLTLATAVSSPTFTVDEGYTGASTKYINANYIPDTDATNFSQNAASIGAWSLTSGALAGQMFGTTNVSLYPRYVDNNAYWNINGAGVAEASTDGSGLWCMSRTGSTTSVLYRNGASFDTSTNASGAVSSQGIHFLENANEWWLGQCSCAFLGGGLNATEAANFYTRLQTYMTAVGL